MPFSSAITALSATHHEEQKKKKGKKEHKNDKILVRAENGYKQKCWLLLKCWLLSLLLMLLLLMLLLLLLLCGELCEMVGCLRFKMHFIMFKRGERSGRPLVMASANISRVSHQNKVDKIPFCTNSRIHNKWATREASAGTLRKAEVMEL